MTISRYQKYTTNDGNYYDFIIYPNIQINQIDFFEIYPNQNDRLDLIAKRYLGNSKLWWLIALINNLQGDSIKVQPQTKIYIPKQVYKYVY